MGLWNAVCVSTNWASLDGAPFKVLTRIALIIPDRTAEPRWYGSTSLLAEALGRCDPPEDDQSEAAVKYRAQTSQSVKRAVASLVKAGALRLVVRPTFRRRAEYAVTFGPIDEGSLLVGTISASRDKSQGASQGPAMGASESPAMGASEGPAKENYEENYQEHYNQGSAGADLGIDRVDELASKRSDPANRAAGSRRRRTPLRVSALTRIEDRTRFAEVADGVVCDVDEAYEAMLAGGYVLPGAAAAGMEEWVLRGACGGL